MITLQKTDKEIIGDIPIQFAKQASELKLGIWNPKEKLWHFPKTPNAASELITAFKQFASYIDEEIFLLAQKKETLSKLKSANDLPDIPGQTMPAWNHQRQGYHFGKELPGVMLAMDMGTGKTKTATGLIINRPHKINLVVCPKSVISVWPGEIKKHTKEQFTIAALNKGTTDKKQKYAEAQKRLSEAKQSPLLVIVNYESYWREKLAKWIKEQHWDNIIFDESHRIKSPSGKAAKFAAQLYKNSNYRIGLTGTPMPHSPLDIFAQYRAISPDIFGGNYHRFKIRYAVMGGFNNKQVIEYQNQKELSEKFDRIAFQVSADVLDLPEAIHSYRTCQLDSKTKRIYNELDKDLYAEIEDGEITPANAMVKVLRLQQLTSGYLKTDDGDLIQYGDEKRKLLEDIISNEIPLSEPLVIFARFTSDIENIRTTCEAAGRSTGELSGIANNLEKWQNGKANVLAVQIRSGGVGIDLTRAAYCIYYSMGHSLGDYTQSLARTHRPGQKRTVRYYHLLAEDTVDVTVYNALRNKKEVIDRILTGYKDSLEDIE